MLPDPIVFYPAVKTGGSHPVLISAQAHEMYRTGLTLNGANYVANLQGTALPANLKISHQVVGKGNAVRDRHYLRMETPSEDGEAIGTRTPLSVGVIFDVPRNYIHDDAGEVLYLMLLGLLGGQGNLIAHADDVPDLDAFVGRVVRGES